MFICVSMLRAEEPLNGTYVATAYAQKGITASGQRVHRHVIAADPDILPIGTRIKIKRAGRYSGEYVVADTGDNIQGRRLDIYLPSVVACKKFGVKPVKVKIVELGDGTHQGAKLADQKVKQEVQQDLARKVVGNAATETDWVASGGSEKPEKPKSAAAGTTGTTAKKNANTDTKTDH
jgi:3D (Asp-Asp-Asp) domain-containing protein